MAKTKVKHKQKNYSLQKNSLSSIKIVGTILVTVIVGLLVYSKVTTNIAEKNKQIQIDERNKLLIEDFKKTITPTSTPEPTPAIVGTLDDSIKYYCNAKPYADGTMPVAKLPFTFSEDLKTYFDFSNYANCRKDDDVLSFSHSSDPEALYKGRDYLLYLFPFDKGVPDFLNREEFGYAISVNGQSYRIQFDVPDGGYQVQADGVWIILYKEYVDRTTNTRVRASRFAILKDQEIIDYYEPYKNYKKAERSKSFHDYTSSLVENVLLKNDKFTSQFAQWGVKIQKNLDGVIFNK